MSTTKAIAYVFVGIGSIILLMLSSQILEVNHAGFIQIKQSAINGDMSVRSDPGMYPQLFGTITTYKISDEYNFTAPEDQIGVRFGDAAVAKIPGQIKYRLPTDAQSILRINADFRSDDAVHSQMIRQVVSNAIKQAATYFRAEDVYSTRRSDFIDLINDQIKEGIYATTYTEAYVRDEVDETKSNLVKLVAAKVDKDGKRIINERSAFDIYGIDLIQLSIGDPDFDDKTDGLIAKRKEAEQERVVAKANAERAKQDAITAQEQGKANVAIAEASALVEAKKAIVEAEKNTKVAQQRALQAEEEKKAIIAKGEADAAATKLKVAAGLSPLEKANIDMQTAIGVAGELAKVKLPGLMVIGGDGKGGQIDPFAAVGLESFIRMSKGLSKSEG